MAETGFERERFSSRLATRRLGRTLIARDTVESTNDAAWEALAAGAPDGTAVVADRQTRGRGRAGRSWHTAPGSGLALSVLLRPRGAPRDPSGGAPPGPRVLPLAAGLALARALEGLGANPELKWPNDLLLSGRKLSGILCEARHPAGGRGAADGEAVVVGVGVNVAETRADFPPEIRDASTSLALEGLRLDRETVAAEFLNALEPLWDGLAEGSGEAVIEAWRRRAAFWGRPVRVRTTAGVLSGVARTLDRDGALVLALDAGGETAVLAGDLEPGG